MRQIRIQHTQIIKKHAEKKSAKKLQYSLI